MRVSLDTNILVYAADSEAGGKHRAACDLVTRATGVDCVLAVQCLAEFANVALRKRRQPLAAVRGFLDDWRSAFPLVVANSETLPLALDATDRHGVAFWDAMLWATLRQAGCRLLLTEDMQDGRRIDGVTIVNPFRPENAKVVDLALSPPLPN